MHSRIEIRPARQLCKILTMTLTVALVSGTSYLLSSCRQVVRWDDTGNPPLRSQAEPSGSKGSLGNPPFYEVFGRRYYVLDSSQGFRERGVASWYGKEFHGKPTSSGTVYDMHALTAAHKTLPLPTRVRVRNLENGRSVVVTVNDRGPFVANRIIDLSYAAATRLDMISKGTALVEIVAVTNPVPAVDGEPAVLVADAGEPVDINLYLQVGAFGDRSNALQLLDRLHGSNFLNAIMLPDTDRETPIYRVRLGPIANVAEYDQLVERMNEFGIVDTHLVTESGNASGS